MSFANNRMDFEEALEDCVETIETLDVLIKPEILDKFIHMIEEYRIHYSSDIDNLKTEVDDLRTEIDTLENRVYQLLDEKDNLEDKIKNE